MLEHLLETIFGLLGSEVNAIDGPNRFYVLWRYTYKASQMDAGVPGRMNAEGRRMGYGITMGGTSYVIPTITCFR